MDFWEFLEIPLDIDERRLEGEELAAETDPSSHNDDGVHRRP